MTDTPDDPPWLTGPPPGYEPPPVTEDAEGRREVDTNDTCERGERTMSEKTKTVRLQVERVRTETVMVDVPIDVAEYEEWILEDGSGYGWTKEAVCEFLEADVDWPENLDPIVDGLAWTPSSVIDDEYTMQVPDDEAIR